LLTFARNLENKEAKQAMIENKAVEIFKIELTKSNQTMIMIKDNTHIRTE